VGKNTFIFIFSAMMLAASGCGLAPLQTPQAGEPLAREADIAQPKPKSAYAEHINTLLQGLFAEKAKDTEVAARHFYALAQETRDPALPPRAVQAAVRAKNHELALQSAQLWTEIEPDSVEARQTLIAVLLQQGKNEQAMQEMDGLLTQTNELHPQQLLLLARMLRREENQEAAVQLLEKVIAKRGERPDALYLYAQLLEEQGNLPKATEMYRKLVALEPANPKFITTYTQLLVKQDKFTEVLAFLQKTVAKFPDQSQWRLLYVRLLLEQGQGEEAKRHMAKLLADTPEDPDLRMTMALLAIKMDDWPSAKKHLRKLLEFRQEADIARYLLGELEEDQGNWEEAMRWFRQVEPGQHYFAAQGRMVGILLEQRKEDDALQLLRKTKAEDQEEELALLAMEAEILTRIDKKEDALAAYNAYLAKNPDTTDALYQRGLFAERLDRLDILEQDLRRVIALEPENVEAMNALGYTLADRTDRYEEAYQLIQTALTKKPTAFHILDSMGWVLYRMKQYDKALTYLRQAYEKNPDPEVAAHLGEVLWVQGQKHEATKIWQESAKAHPDHPKLHEVMQRFLP